MAKPQAKLQDIIKYIVSQYPNRSSLTKFRLIKILYLADWRSAILRRKQMTSIRWFLRECGLQPDPDIDLPRKGTSAFFVDKVFLSVEDKEILDHAIKTSKKQWTDFISIVYSTYPFFAGNSSEDRELNLVQLASLYEKMKMEQINNDRTLSDSDSGIR